MARKKGFRFLKSFAKELEKFSDKVEEELKELSKADNYTEPRVDFVSTEQKVIFHIDLAGARKKDIELFLEGGSLVVRAERKSVTGPDIGEEEDVIFYKKERGMGNYYRVIPLLSNIDKKSIKTSYRECVLVVEMKKLRGIAETSSKKFRIAVK